MGDLTAHIDQYPHGLVIGPFLLDRDGRGCVTGDGYELGAAVSGRGVLVHGETKTEICAGDVYFLDRITPHAHNPDRGGRLGGLSIRIDSQAIESLAPVGRLDEIIRPFNLVRRGSIPPVLHGSPGAHGHLTRARDAYLSGDACGHFAAWSSVLMAIVEINRELLRLGGMLPRAQEEGGTAALNRAVDLIRDRYLENLNLEEIASRSCISISGLCHLFSLHMRTSPIRFRNKLRTNHAILLLKTTDQTVESIAFACGFLDVTSFRRVFGHITGRRPSDYREEAGAPRPHTEYT